MSINLKGKGDINDRIRKYTLTDFVKTLLSPSRNWLLYEMISHSQESGIQLSHTYVLQRNN